MVLNQGLSINPLHINTPPNSMHGDFRSVSLVSMIHLLKNLQCWLYSQSLAESMKGKKGLPVCFVYVEQANCFLSREWLVLFYLYVATILFFPHRPTRTHSFLNLCFGFFFFLLVSSIQLLFCCIISKYFLQRQFPLKINCYQERSYVHSW